MPQEIAKFVNVLSQFPLDDVIKLVLSNPPESSLTTNAFTKREDELKHWISTASPRTRRKVTSWSKITKPKSKPSTSRKRGFPRSGTEEAKCAYLVETFTKAHGIMPIEEDRWSSTFDFMPEKESTDNDLLTLYKAIEKNDGAVQMKCVAGSLLLLLFRHKLHTMAVDSDRIQANTHMERLSSAALRKLSEQSTIPVESLKDMRGRGTVYETLLVTGGPGWLLHVPEELKSVFEQNYVSAKVIRMFVKQMRDTRTDLCEMWERCNEAAFDLLTSGWERMSENLAHGLTYTRATGNTVLCNALHKHCPKKCEPRATAHADLQEAACVSQIPELTRSEVPQFQPGGAEQCTVPGVSADEYGLMGSEMWHCHEIDWNWVIANSGN